MNIQDSAVFRKGIIIDETTSEKTIAYTENGTLKVSLPFLKSLARGTEMSVYDLAGEMEKVRHAESMGDAESLAILDESKNLADFIKNLNVFIAAGNGQYILQPGLIKAMEDMKALDGYVALARKNGVQLFVDLRVSGKESNYYAQRGFAGYLEDGHLKDFVGISGSDGLSAEVIVIDKEKRNISELKTRVKGSDKQVKIIPLNLISECCGNERSVEQKPCILDFFKASTALSMFQPEKIDADYVRRVVKNWKWDSLPSSIDNIENDPGVKAYLFKLENDVGSDKARNLKSVLIETMTERVLTRTTLSQNGNYLELVNKSIERALGHLLRMPRQTGTLDDVKDDENFKKIDKEIREINGNALDAYVKIDAKIIDVLKTSDSNPIDAAIAIQLILLYSERKTPQMNGKKTDSFDVREIRTLLTAA